MGMSANCIVQVVGVADGIAVSVGTTGVSVLVGAVVVVGPPGVWVGAVVGVLVGVDMGDLQARFLGG